MAYMLEPTTAVAALRRPLAIDGSLLHPGAQVGVAVGVGVGVPPPPVVPTSRKTWSGSFGISLKQIGFRSQVMQFRPYALPGCCQAAVSFDFTERPCQNHELN